MIQQIEDFDAKELDIYARMSENQVAHIFEPAPGAFIAESPMIVKRALDAGYEPISLLVAKEKLAAILTDFDGYNLESIPIYTAKTELLENITGIKLTRGLLCAMRRKPISTISEICKGKKRIAILENVMNPTNVGAIFRSAAGLGIEGIILSPGCSDPLYRRAARVSMGAVFALPWTIAPMTTDEWKCSGIEEVKAGGFSTLAMALKEDSYSIDDKAIKDLDRVAIVLGSEGYGLYDESIEKCDYTVMIPMFNGVDSLNVAAASAVAFWELR